MGTWRKWKVYLITVRTHVLNQLLAPFLHQLGWTWKEVADDRKFLPPLLSDILVPELLFCFSSPTLLLSCELLCCYDDALGRRIWMMMINSSSRVLGVVYPNLYMSSPKALSDIILIHLNSPTATQEFRLGSGGACFGKVVLGGWLIKFHSSLLWSNNNDTLLS